MAAGIKYPSSEFLKLFTHAAARGNVDIIRSGFKSSINLDNFGV